MRKYFENLRKKVMICLLCVLYLSACSQPKQDHSLDSATSYDLDESEYSNFEQDLESDVVYFLNCEDLPEEASGWTTPAGDRIMIQSNGHWGMIDVGMAYTDVMEEQAQDELEQLIAYNGGHIELDLDRIMIQSNGHWGMIDVGMAYTDVMEEQAQDELEQLIAYNGGHIELDFIIITHAHIDHYGYFAEMFENHSNLSMSDEFKVYFKYESDKEKLSIDNTKNEEVYRDILTVLEKRFGENAKNHILTSDYPDIVWGDFSISFYNDSLDAINQEKPNNTSTVVYMRHNNGTDILFMGDVEKDREATLLSGELSHVADIDILKAGHHGLPSSTGMEFFSHMNPSDVVVTGLDGMYNPSDDETLAYKCLLNHSNLYGTYFNPDGLRVVFGKNPDEYTFYGSLTQSLSPQTVPMKAGTVRLKEYYEFLIDDTLKKVG